MPDAATGFQMGMAVPGRLSAMGQALSNLSQMGFQMGNQEREAGYRQDEISATGAQQRQTMEKGAAIKKQEAKDEYDLTMDFLNKLNKEHPDSPAIDVAHDALNKTLEMRRNAPGMPPAEQTQLPSGPQPFAPPGGYAPGMIGERNAPPMQYDIPPEAAQPSVPVQESAVPRRFGSGDPADTIPEGVTVKVGNATVTGNRRSQTAILGAISQHPEDFSDADLAALSKNEEGFRALQEHRRLAAQRHVDAIKAKAEAEGKPLEQRTENMAFQDAYLNAVHEGKSKEEARLIAAKEGKANGILMAQIAAGRADLVNQEYLDKRIGDLQDKVDTETATPEDLQELGTLKTAKNRFSSPTPAGAVTDESIRADFKAGKLTREEAVKKLKANGRK